MDQTRALVYAITLNWNRPLDTLACLEALTRLTYPRLRLLVVDNGSTDESLTIIRGAFPDLEMACNARNLGFGAGMNAGIQHALSHGADYVFLVNNDAIVAPDALDELVQAAILTGAGMVAPKIFYHAEHERIWSVGARRHAWTLEMIDDAIGEKDTPHWQHIVERDYLVGCALLISRQAIQDVGLFDERFFMYYEDLDLSLRMQRSGYRLFLAPRAHVWHKVSLSSGGRESPMERYWMGRSSSLFFRKYTQRWRWLIVGPYRLGSAIKTSLRLLVRRRGKALLAYWRGLYDGWRLRLTP